MTALTTLSPEGRVRLLTISAAGAALVAFADYEIKPNVSLGYLYIVPILIASGSLARWQIVICAAACAVLREVLGPFPADEFIWPRELLVFGAFLCSGLLVREMAESRRRADGYARQLEAEVKLRMEAEEQLRVLVDSNPAAIFTTDQELRILLANDAAARLFGCGREELATRRLDEFLPHLRRVPIHSGKRFFRTNMECTGQRDDGSFIAADVWFSTYITSRGPRLAAIVLDSTDELREREDLNLDSLLTNSRVLVGAVLHEIRNLSAAASVAHANLQRLPSAAESQDFQALGTLVESLEQVASAELAMLANREGASADLAAVLREFQLVAGPSVSEIGASLVIQSPPILRARIDRHSLLQVLLNLGRNSIRALEGAPLRTINVEATALDDLIYLRFRDSGPGVEDAARLFQPFSSASDTTGLGLYVSRALVRSFSGELYHEPDAAGAEFVIRLHKSPARTGGSTHDDSGHTQHSGTHPRRSQPVPAGPGAPVGS